MKKQLGRSMIEMLGVLAIVGVLSIVGITMYRRAVNNHHANTILDDVNRFAFVITEKGGYPLEQVIPKGDFKESGIYQLEGYQDVEANQFSITVENVPKGVCEALLPKAAIEYKVRVNPNTNEKGKVYDTLNTELCQNDTNIMVFYFGDTVDICNDPDESNYTPCTVNADCCGGEFCAFENGNEDGMGKGTCRKISTYRPVSIVASDGSIWVRSKFGLSWWSTQNWCTAQGMHSLKYADIGCNLEKIDEYTYCKDSPILPKIQENGNYQGRVWFESTPWNSGGMTIFLSDGKCLGAGYYNNSIFGLCH